MRSTNINRGDLRCLREYTKKILWAFGFVFVIRCAASFSQIKDSFSVYLIFSLIGEAITITMILAVLYERFFWAFDKTSKVPVVKGKYQGNITSDWDGQKRDATLEIKQTLLKVSVIMKTDESSSGSVSASIDEISYPSPFVLPRSNTLLTSLSL